MRQQQSIIVYGNPRGKGRPRFTRNGRTYTDAATTEYEGRIKKVWKCENNFKFPASPITIIVIAFFRVPVSLSKKKVERTYGKPHMHKPDADNIAKIVLDALNGIAFDDDRFVTSLTVEKQYCRNEDERPRIEVHVLGGDE